MGRIAKQRPRINLQRLRENLRNRFRAASALATPSSPTTLSRLHRAFAGGGGGEPRTEPGM